jgi:hypothetical protein
VIQNFGAKLIDLEKGLRTALRTKSAALIEAPALTQLCRHEPQRIELAR